MQLGRYEIENYYVVINNATEMRQRIAYMGSNEEDYFVERYYGTIRDGYDQPNTSVRNLNLGDIKSHIPGESLVIVDKSNPPKPMMYISLASIQSIERSGDKSLIIIDYQIEPTTLEFLTTFDCDQAHSLLIYILQNPSVDIGAMNADIKPPVIFFNENFFGSKIALDSDPSMTGPLSTEDGNLFRVSMQMSSYEGPMPISKGDIISGMIYDITDDREGSLQLADTDVIIYKDAIGISNEVDEISQGGEYMVRFNLLDLSRNENTSTIIISLI